MVFSQVHLLSLEKNTLDLENSEKLKLEHSIQVIKTAIGNL